MRFSRAWHDALQQEQPAVGGDDLANGAQDRPRLLIRPVVQDVFEDIKVGAAHKKPGFLQQNACKTNKIHQMDKRICIYRTYLFENDIQF